MVKYTKIKAVQVKINMTITILHSKLLSSLKAINWFSIEGHILCQILKILALITPFYRERMWSLGRLNDLLRPHS